MIAQSTRYTTICLGLAGSLVLASAALADIPVTGGRLTGQAGFFIPDARGNTVLFDVATRTLRLQTPNGTTVDSRFIPTLGVLDPVGNRLPQAGDTGRLGGLLSGRAFDPAGNPFPFANVPLAVNFRVNSFTPNIGFLLGTLISPVIPGDASPVFLPVLNANLDPISSIFYNADNGSLNLGEFDANLPSGLIGLPPSVRFGTPRVTEFDIPPDVITRTERLIEFSFSGIGNLQNDSSINFVTGDLYYNSLDAVTDFRLQVQGTPYVIQGTGINGTQIRIDKGFGEASTLGGPFQGFIGPVGFAVDGVGSGSSTNAPPFGFRSRNTSTNFAFVDNFGTLIVGSNTGSIVNFDIYGTFNFTVSSFSGITPNPRFNAVDISNAGNFVPALVTPPTSIIPGNPGNPGGGSDNGPGLSNSTFIQNIDILDINITNIDITNVTGTQSETTPSTVTQTGDTVTVTQGTSTTTYDVLGPGSRVFPGLMGLVATNPDATSGNSSPAEGTAGGTPSTDSPSTPGGTPPADQPTSPQMPGLGGSSTPSTTPPSDSSSTSPSTDPPNTNPSDPGTGPGSSQANPVMPTTIIIIINIPVFIFTEVPSGQWFDPPMAKGYEYVMKSDSTFTSISGFPKGIDADDRFTVVVDGKTLGEFKAGQTLKFSDYKAVLGDSLVNGGVKKFTVRDIDPAVDATNPRAFPLKLDFNTPKASFEQRAVES